VGKYILLSDEDLAALDDALRVAGVKYHGGKQFDKATNIRRLRRRIKTDSQHVPIPGDKVIDLDLPANYAVVSRVYEPDHTGRYQSATLYYPELDIVCDGVKTTSLMDARDSDTRSVE
jgi:hypothetical protein